MLGPSLKNMAREFPSCQRFVDFWYGDAIVTSCPGLLLIQAARKEARENGLYAQQLCGYQSPSHDGRLYGHGLP